MRVAVLLTIVAALLGWSRQSYADVQEVTVERSGQEPSCLEAGLVVEALVQDASLRVTLSSAPTESEKSVLKISGSNERFTLYLSSGGREVRQLFEGVACAAAPQVVTAYVSSILSTQVELATQTPPIEAPIERVDPVLGTSVPAALAADVREELELRGFRLGAEGLSLSIARTTERRWAIWLTNVQTSCAVYRELTQPASEAREAMVERFTTLAVSMFGSTGSCLRPQVVERAELLEETLKPLRHQGKLSRVGGLFEAGAGMGVATLALAADTDRDLSRGLLVGGSAIWIAGGLASFAMDEHPYAGTVGIVSGLVGAGTMSLSAAFMGGSEDVNGMTILDDQRHDAFVIGALSLYGTAAVLAWDRHQHPQTSHHRTAENYARVKTKKKREALSRDDVAQIEEDLVRSGSPTSWWLLLSPVLVGGAVSVAAAIREDNDAEKGLFAIVGAGLLTEGLLLGALGSVLDPLRLYGNKLKDADLELRLVPTGNGLSAVGRF